MKKTLNLIALIVGMSFFFTGCYTIVWDPREEFPDTENYNESTEFYETDYFGGYGSYYETPWWINMPVFVTYPGESDKSLTKERSSERSSSTENIRNSSGRGNTDRNPEIINTNTTTTTTTTTNSGSSNDSNVSTTPPPTRDSSSSSSSSTNSSTSNTRSSGNNDTRNNSGTRNSGSGRR